jgi:hypothetical protein
MAINHGDFVWQEVIRTQSVLKPLINPDHCIETLWISIMCHTDLSLHTFRWNSNSGYRPHARSNAKRERGPGRSGTLEHEAPSVALASSDTQG